MTVNYPDTTVAANPLSYVILPGAAHPAERNADGKVTK